jgi:hypothetical protein
MANMPAPIIQTPTQPSNANITGGTINGQPVANMPTTAQAAAVANLVTGNVDTTHNQVLTAAQLAEIVASLTAPSVVSTNTYTPVLTDAFLVKAMTYAGAVAVTLPQDSDLAFPVGSSITFKCANANGKVTFAAGTGATMTVARAGCASLIPQNAWGEVYKYAANTWELIGPFVG